MRTKLKRPVLFILLPVVALLFALAIFLTVWQPLSAAALNGPQLKIDSNIYAPPNSTVVIPVQFASNGNQISSMVFSVDYDQTKLNYDDSVPDSIVFNLPGQFAGSCSPDTADPDGELDCFIIDPVAPLSPLPDGVLVSIKLRTLNPTTPTTAKVGFSQSSPPTSFGNTEGQSVPGSTLDGSVYINPTPPSETTETPTATATPPGPPGVEGGFVFLPFISMLYGSSPGPTATPTPPTVPGCGQTIVNGGFENKTGWDIVATMYNATYTQENVHTGLWSMRTGILKSADNVFSYSSFRQTVKIPADAVSAQLSFWLFQQSGEKSLQAEMPLMMTQPMKFEEMPLAGDLQYVIILDAGNNWIDTLVWQLKNNQSWVEKEFDLMKHAGKTIQLHFGSFNDGSDGVTSMYVDDVSLIVCD